MHKLRSYRKVITILCIPLVLTSCSSKTTAEESNYNTRRKTPIVNEILMDQMNYYNPESDIDVLPIGILETIKDEVESLNIFYYDKDDINLMFYVKDSLNPGSIWIQGKEYPFSFGEYYYPQSSEAPEVCFYDINQDGILDIMLRGEAYRTLIRQEVYLSNKEGSYREMGDITWKSDSQNSFSFTATYEDNYQVHVTALEYGIDEWIDIGTSFLPIAKELGMYDQNGKVKEKTTVEDLQSQAVRYILQDDGSVILRYEAQIWTGYSEYCLGHCFVFEYKITNEGYQLLGVSLDKFDY